MRCPLAILILIVVNNTTSPSSGSAPIQDEGFTQGAALPDDFKLWLSRHPGLTFDEALHRYREEQKAKQRRKGPKM